MRSILIPIFTFLAFFCLHESVQAQLFPGIKVNGQLKNVGDTVFVCKGSSLLYEHNATGFSSMRWRFKLGTPASSNSASSQSIVYNVVGTDSTVQFISNGANADSMFIIVKVSDTKPQAAFQFSPNNACGQIPIGFTNTSTGVGNQYVWSFGDGTTQTTVNPNHAFLNAIGASGSQSFQVQLVATNALGCKDSITKPVTVSNVPDASIGNADAGVAVGLFNGVTTFSRCGAEPTYVFQFNNQSTTIASNLRYTIQWGDGSPDSVFNAWPASNIIQHRYAVGSTLLTVRVTGANGCIGIKTYQIFLGTNPVGSLASLGNTDLCAPDSLRFVISGFSGNTAGTIYRFIVNDGSAPQVFSHPPPDTITHHFNYSSCGTNSSNGATVFQNAFQARLDIENPCASNSVSVNPILVSSKPKAIVSFTTGNVACVNTPVTVSSGSFYGGVVTATGGGGSSCNNTGKQVWQIVQAAGYTIVSGTLGSINGDAQNGNGWTSGSANLQVVFSLPGLYTFKLYLFNGKCGVDSSVKTICVRNPVQASYTMSNRNACLTGTTTINNTSSNNGCLGETYHWQVTYFDPLGCGSPVNNYSFINGTNANSINPAFQFNRPGKYAIQLSVTANGSGLACPPAVFVDTFKLKGRPKLSMNRPASICPNNTINPSISISGCYADSPLLYQWIFTNGTPFSSTQAMPTNILYSMVGNHSILLNVISECGISTDTTSITVVPPPVANAGNDTFMCSGVPTPIGVPAGLGLVYAWSPTQGLSNSAIATPLVNRNYIGVNADSTFKYIVTVFATPTCSSKDSVLVKVRKLPTVTVTPDSTTICQGNSVALSAFGANTFQWQPATGLNTTVGANVMARPLASTVYKVVGKDGFGCADTAQVQVVVQAFPNTFSGPDSTVCNTTSSIVLNGTPAGGSWSGPFVSTAGVFNAMASGLGSFVLTYTASNGICDKKDSLTITVTSTPNVFAGNDSSICQSNLNVQLNGQPSGGSWSGSPMVSADGQFTPTITGMYQLIYAYGIGSCIINDTVNITVNPQISNNQIGSNQTICTNTQPSILLGTVSVGGNGIQSYQWESSLDGVVWQDVIGANALNYQPPTLTQSTYYRRKAFTTLCSGLQASWSEVVLIEVKPDAQARFMADTTNGCTPFVLDPVIHVTLFPEGNSSYQWFADGVLIGSNSTGTFPGYVINLLGDTVVIQLRTSSPFGCKSDSMEMAFNTLARSNARFIKSIANGCGPLSVNFSNTSSSINSNIQFFWDFGNGITSNLTQPGTVVFAPNPNFKDTTYYIRLQAFNGCDTTVWLDSVFVRTRPKARFGLSTTTGCSPLPIQVFNNSFGSPATYYWDFGNGDRDTTFSTGTFNYTYNTGNATDTFIIRLVVVNTCGTDTTQLQVTVAPNLIQPFINIGGSQLFGCAPHQVTFNNNSLGANSLTWDFTDGSSPVITSNTDPSLVHVFANPGVYPVAITLGNGCTDTTVYRTVTVYAQPVAAFTTNRNTYCTGDTVGTNNASTNANGFSWNWGDGTSSSATQPNHVYTVPGNYTIRLQANRINASGMVCFDTVVNNIVVLAQPNVQLQTNLANVNCAPFTLQVSAPAIINELVTWTIYDSTVTPSLIDFTGTTAQYTFQRPGTFYVKMKARNAAGCADSVVQSFSVKGTPVAHFTPGNLSVCSRDTLVAYLNTTTYNGTDALGYRWVVDNTLQSTNGNFNHRYTVSPATLLPHVFNTWLVVSNTFGCVDTAKAVLQMNPAADARFSIANTRLCVPFVLAVNNSSSNATDYQWWVNAQPVDTAAIPVLPILQGSTQYDIMLVANNSYGCVPDTQHVVFTTINKPRSAFQLSDTLGCSGSLNVATTNNSVGANAYVWNWGDGSATNTFFNPTYVYPNQGQYQVSLVASDGTCADTAYQLVRVSLKPSVAFTQNNTITCDSARVQFSNLTSGNYQYRWSFGDGSTSTLSDPYHVYAPAASPYTVKLVTSSTFGCSDSLIKPNLVLAKLKPESDFYISPSSVISVPNYTFQFNNLTLNNPTHQYQWSLGDGSFQNTYNISHLYRDTGNYPVRLIVLDTLTRCTDTTIRVARIDGVPGYLFVPNAICPGCIQSNLRSFLPKGTGLASYQLQIFTTWGELVFETHSLDNRGAPNQEWDGRFKGNLVQQDVFVWKIQAVYKNGTEWLGMKYPEENEYKKVGTITVIK